MSLKRPRGAAAPSSPKCQPPRVLFLPRGASAGNAANAEFKGADFYQRREGRRDIYRVFLDLAGGALGLAPRRWRQVRLPRKFPSDATAKRLPQSATRRIFYLQLLANI